SALLMRNEHVLYGRYWGAVSRVDCLHFEVAYYAPIAWAIAQGCKRFEGGAQGEHKLARGFTPAKTYSAHWLREPRFADAVARFLDLDFLVTPPHLPIVRGIDWVRPLQT
ncbi:MAG: hypothetical protein RIQ29_985, partial [Pseudomonadota bacterium]